MYTLGTNMHHLEVNEVANCPSDTVAFFSSESVMVNELKVSDIQRK